MAQRIEPHDSLDDFPTQPWGSRALVDHVLIGGGWRRDQIAEMTVHECAANRGYMARPLAERFKAVHSSDVFDYGFCETHDFLLPGRPLFQPDWVITNPPFRLGTEFILRGLEIAKVGVAMLVRTAFLEGNGRYETLYSQVGRKPIFHAPFVERLPLVKGRVDPKASTATSYSWLVWAHEHHHHGTTVTRWIPPCRKQLERPGDYE